MKVRFVFQSSDWLQDSSLDGNFLASFQKVLKFVLFFSFLFII